VQRGIRYRQTLETALELYKRMVARGVPMPLQKVTIALVADARGVTNSAVRHHFSHVSLLRAMVVLARVREFQGHRDPCAPLEGWSADE
jgi:AcrR family transcriptional regulator